MATQTQLEEGKRYRFRYRQQSGNYRWYEWEFVGTYLGLAGPGGGKLCFHMRPAADTGYLNPADLVSATPVDASVPNRQPRRFKGAVEAPTNG